MRPSWWTGLLLFVCALPATVLAQGMPGGFSAPWPDDRTPVQLRLPDEIRIFATQGPDGVSFSTRLALPALRFWPTAVPCQGFCPGVVLLTVRTGDRSEMYADVWRLRRAMARASAAAAPAATYTPIAPIAGFTEAWQEEPRVVSAMPGMAAVTQHHLRGPPEGPPVEYVTCVTRWNVGTDPPRCTALMTLDGTPAVQISATFAMQHLSEHAHIRAGLMRVVGGWR